MEIAIKVHKTCRCCLSKDGRMKNILKDSFLLGKIREINLIDGYSICSGIPNKNLVESSCNICVSCEAKLAVSYEFREMCQKSHNIIQSQILESKNALVDVKVELTSDEEQPSVHRAPERKTPRQGNIQNITEVVFVNKEPDNDEMKYEPLTASDYESDDNSKSFFDDGTGADDSEGRPIFFCFHCDTNYFSYVTLKKHWKKMHKENVKMPIRRECNLCKNKTLHYMKHLKENHKNYLPNKCQLCRKAFLIHADLVKHLRSHKVDVFKCMSSDCSMTFVSQTYLRIHISNDQHKLQDKYRCPTCGLDFIQFLDLYNHFKTNHDPQNVKKLFPCYKCKKIHRIERFILRHSCNGAEIQRKIKQKHEKNTNPDQSHKCGKCGDNFESDDALVCHKFSICLDDPKFVCPTCGKECINQMQLKAHKRTHKKSLYICDECGYTAIEAHVFKRHKITHQTERLEKCQLCSASFKCVYTLAHHQSIHREPKYECHHCSHKFRTLHTLKHHILACHIGYDHTTTKHACELCGKRFGNRRCLEQHIRKHTGERIKCKVCLKDFSHISGLNNHIRSIHEGRNFECVYCNQTFCSRSRLKEHLFVHRGISPYNCVSCSQKYVRKYLYIKHLITHNIEYDEAIHGYREMEDINSIIAGSLRINKNPEMAPSASKENERAAATLDTLMTWNNTSTPLQLNY